MQRRLAALTLPVVAGTFGVASALHGHHHALRPVPAATSPAEIDHALLAASERPAAPVAPSSADSPQAPRVHAFGNAAAAAALRGFATGIARTPSGQGYWVVSPSGRVSAHGDATPHGDLTGRALASPVVGIAATPDGGGYWLVAADGTVYPFGDAHHLGSAAPSGSHVVGLASMAGRQGYWTVTAAGTVQAFGAARFYGDLPADPAASPVTAIAAAPSGLGYWLVTAAGGVAPFGRAGFYGSLPARHESASVTTITASPTGRGYWMTARNGRIFRFGDAGYFGATVVGGAHQAVGLTPSAGGLGYWELESTPSPQAAQVAQPAAVPLGPFEVTCYDLSGITASGVPVNSATVAVDPSVIPLGSTIYIQGVGTRIAEDTGGAIIGDHVDIWEPSYATCADWGVQTREVWREP